MGTWWWGRGSGGDVARSFYVDVHWGNMSASETTTKVTNQLPDITTL